MADVCAVCTNELAEGAALCAHCGAAVEAPATESAAGGRPQPTPAEVQATLAGVNEPAYKVDDSLTGIGGWLILVAINLALAPLYCIFGIFIDLRGLYSPLTDQVLATHHGLAALILFEASTNTIFLLALIGLNFFFYGRKKPFPKLMIAYLAIHLVFVVVDHFATMSLHMGGSQTGPLTMIRAAVYTIIWIPYFMNSIRVEQTFTG